MSMRWIYGWVLAARLGMAEPCSDFAGREFSRLFGAPADQVTEIRQRIARIAHSRIVEGAIREEGSPYREFFSAIRRYDRRRGKMKLNVGDRAFAAHSDVFVEGDTLVLRVNSLRVGELAYGQLPPPNDRSMFKFVGALLRGVDENLRRTPNRFRAVRIIGNVVVNERLAQTLRKFGFESQDPGWLDQAKYSATVSADLLEMTSSAVLAVPYSGSFQARPRDAKDWVLELPLADAP